MKVKIKAQFVGGWSPAFGRQLCSEMDVPEDVAGKMRKAGMLLASGSDETSKDSKKTKGKG